MRSGTRISSPLVWAHSVSSGKQLPSWPSSGEANRSYAFEPFSSDARMLTCHLSTMQLCTRPAHQPKCRHQEDHETLQHTSSRQANLPRVEAAQAPETRERYFPKRHFHFASRRSVRCRTQSRDSLSTAQLTLGNSYFVTELLGTDLHRLLTSRPLEKQFIQYFLYQIMVRHAPPAIIPETKPDVLTRGFSQNSVA